ncbi:MAG: CRISPR-associated protein Csx3 [Chloroflexi bacterium]|nr:MAG: CRISPR-associated protein Csx3 [Chloroflexota bacterium]
MELFPAILIGGPPHMGKSVLTYSLTHALRERGIQHYVIRAYPDGEGDWANESDQKLVRRIRIKGQGIPQWVDRICRDIAARHLPLIVDVGGRPTSDQERIFDCCTHAILLTSDEDTHNAWQAMLARHGLIPLADLHSQLHGRDIITDAGPVLRGVITGLERGTTAAGSTFDALVERVARIFAYDPNELRRTHLALAPVETAVDLDRLARTLGVPFTGEKATWQPHHLPAVLDYLPEAVPLGIYGRGPNWLYAAIALLATPAPFVQFDVRLGWVRAASLPMGTPDPAAPLQVQLHEFPDHILVESSLPTAYLDYSQLETLTMPPVPAGFGIILSGKLPLWLYTSLAITYRAAPWIAVYQPQVGAVVIYSADPAYTGGDVLPLPLPPPR